VRIGEALQGVTSILLDTAPFIYHVERHPTYAPLVQSFFHIRAERSIEIITTPITLAECLVHPLRQDMASLAATYRSVLLDGQGIRFHPLGEGEGTLASRIRAQHSLYLPDALQVAAALTTGCQAIVTNGVVFKRVPSPRTLVLDELEP
jgi:predicted nucleic acid-binding protein